MHFFYQTNAVFHFIVGAVKQLCACVRLSLSSKQRLYVQLLWKYGLLTNKGKLTVLTAQS